MHHQFSHKDVFHSCIKSFYNLEKSFTVLDEIISPNVVDFLSLLEIKRFNY